MFDSEKCSTKFKLCSAETTVWNLICIDCRSVSIDCRRLLLIAIFSYNDWFSSIWYYLQSCCEISKLFTKLSGISCRSLSASKLFCKKLSFLNCNFTYNWLLARRRWAEVSRAKLCIISHFQNDKICEKRYIHIRCFEQGVPWHSGNYRV